MDWHKIDLHMHSTVSDGTDTPAAIVQSVKAAGIDLFSLTDHDATKGCVAIMDSLQAGDPAFVAGVEFSCRDEEGQYHVLGYGYDPMAASVRAVVDKGHGLRVGKLQRRLDYIEREFGFAFAEEDKRALYALDNPGKPHIGNLMVRYGYAADLNEAIKRYLNQFHIRSEYIRPEEAISAILAAGGIPVLAHPSYGRGDECVVGDDMDKRLQKLMAFGLRGVEAFYSGFSPKLQNEMLDFAARYHLFVTAGSDYHGTNKTVLLGDTNLDDVALAPRGLHDFLAAVPILRR